MKCCLCNILFQFRNFKIVYRRYAGLYFCFCVDVHDNNLYYLEAIHNFVEVRPRLSKTFLPQFVRRRIGSIARLSGSSSFSGCKIAKGGVVFSSDQPLLVGWGFLYLTE